MATPVAIAAHDAAWAGEFRSIATALRGRLGAVVLAVDHVGSTAVAGLAAKPVIDVDVTLATPDDIASAGDLLVQAGYEPRGNRYDDGMWAFSLKGRPAQRVYLCAPGNDTHHRRIVFRDRLRAEPVLAAAYAALKHDLAARFPRDGDAYTAAKSRFIAEAVDAAPRI